MTQQGNSNFLLCLICNEKTINELLYTVLNCHRLQRGEKTTDLKLHWVGETKTQSFLKEGIQFLLSSGGRRQRYNKRSKSMRSCEARSVPLYILNLAGDQKSCEKRARLHMLMQMRYGAFWRIEEFSMWIIAIVPWSKFHKNDTRE